MPVSTYAQGGTSVYVYDDNGRLRAVLSPTGQAAKYDYDAAGNPIGIRQPQPTDPFEVLSFSPRRGGVGTQVTIYCFGLSAGVTSVAFNGVNAQIVGTNAVSVVATVPANATTGPITVVTPRGTNITTRDFAVLRDVSIQPSSATLESGASQQFSLNDQGGSGVRWSVNGIEGGNTLGGTVTSSGLYTAPILSRFGINVRSTIRASSIADPSFFAEAQVTVLVPPYNPVVRTLALQPNGKIVIASDFTGIVGNPRSRVARLNDDGTLNTSFQNLNVSTPITGPFPKVQALALQPDGKVLIGGFFTSVGGQPRTNVARLNLDGTLDTSFQNPAVVNSAGDGSTESPVERYVFHGVSALALQPDGKVVIGGSFTSVGGQSRRFLARLNADGELDTSFVDSTVNNRVRTLAIQPDGKILIGGEFTSVGGQARQKLARLNANGTLDTSFANPATTLGGSDTVLEIAVQRDGKVLHMYYDSGFGYTKFERLTENGSLDTSFVSLNIVSLVNAFIIQTDGKIVIGGFHFRFGHRIEDESRRGVARLNGNGTLDFSYLGSNFNNNRFDVFALALQPDGKVVIGGDFISVGGQPRRNLARLNADGTLDTSFVSLF